MKTTTVQIVDDFTGKLLDADDIARVAFSYRGKEYLLETTTATAEKFDRALEKWIAAAQPVQPKRKSKRTARAYELKDVRAWAAENGYEVSTKGRVPNEVLEAYEAAQ